MITRMIRICLALFVVLSLCSPSYSQQATGAQGIVIDRLLKEVQKGLARAQKEVHGKGLPPLQSVTLNLTAEVRRDVGAKLNLYIVSFGHKWEKSRSQEIEVSLKPPSPTEPLKVAGGPSVSDQLVEAIESAAQGVQAASQNEDVPLVASGFKVVLSFVVKGDTSGGVKFEILPITVDLAGDLANSAIQKITVVYQRPEPKK